MLLEFKFYIYPGFSLFNFDKNEVCKEWIFCETEFVRYKLQLLASPKSFADTVCVRVCLCVSHTHTLTQCFLR